ncbi:MAG TPA: hypothetical protein VMU88_10580, partial [bacterium]|nr:hypothetical protein [bacterium]
MSFRPSHLLIPALMSLLSFPASALATIDLSSGYFGNQSVVNSGAAGITLDSDTKQVGFSFEQPEDALVGSVWVYGTPVGSCPQYQVLVYDDD